MKKSLQRQELRTQQRGSLQRSTLMALVLIACAGIALTQLPHLSPLTRRAQDSLVLWAASQGFTVQKLEVKGRKNVPSAHILDTLAIRRGTPIFSYDLKKAQALLAENPWFKTVTVERHLPQTIFVRILERVPAARWQVNGKLAVVDNEGVVLSTNNLDAYKTLPLIIGQQARHRLVDLFALLKGEPSIGRELAAAAWISDRRWDLTLKNGIVVKLPAEQPALALSKLVSYDRKQQVFARDIKVVDLRLPDKAIIQPTGRANILIERPDFSDMPMPGKKNI